MTNSMVKYKYRKKKKKDSLTKERDSKWIH